MKKNISVLITGAGAPGAPGIIKSLRLAKERQIKIVAVDADKASAGFFMADSHYIVPPASQDDFTGRIFEIAKKENVDVIIPLVTRELAKFAGEKERFAREGIAVSVSDPEALAIVNDKHLLMEECQDNGIPVPEFGQAKNFGEFKSFVNKLGYPNSRVCFKPPVSNGMRGFRILDPAADRFDILINEKPTNVVTTLEEVGPVLEDANLFPELLVMEYLPGEEFSVDVLADCGKTLAVVPRTRDKIKMGISFAGTAVNDGKIVEYSKNIVKILGLTGNIGFQFKKDAAGIPKIIESNPRVQGTIVLCTACGANLVYGAVQVALGEPVAPFNIEWGTKMIRYWDEIYYDRAGRGFKL